MAAEHVRDDQRADAAAAAAAEGVADAPETVEHATPKIDQAFWDKFMNGLGERWSQLKTTAMQERTDVEKAEWDDFVWETVVRLTYIVRQHTLEGLAEAPKASRKRAAKVPKAALPGIETSKATDAA